MRTVWDRLAIAGLYAAAFNVMLTALMGTYYEGVLLRIWGAVSTFSLYAVGALGLRFSAVPKLVLEDCLPVFAVMIGHFVFAFGNALDFYLHGVSYYGFIDIYALMDDISVAVFWSSVAIMSPLMIILSYVLNVRQKEIEAFARVG